MEFKIVKSEEIKLIGLKEKIDMKNNGIPALWGKLFERKHELKNVVSLNCYGIAENFSSDFLSFDETVAFEVEDFSYIPKGMVTKVLKPHVYLVFTHKGPIFSKDGSSAPLEKTYEKIYHEVLPKSGYKVNPDFNFEFYDERFSHDDPNSEFDIYIPVHE